MKKALFFTTKRYNFREPAVCHIYGIRHPSANFRGRCCFSDTVLAKSEVNLTVRIRGIVLPWCLCFLHYVLVNISECEKCYINISVFFSLCYPAGAELLLNIICTRTFLRKVFFYGSNLVEMYRLIRWHI